MTFHKAFILMSGFFPIDSSFFSIIHDVDASSAALNNDLVKSQEWAHNWKMSFNPDRDKQAQEVIFSRKFEKGFHHNLSFNDGQLKDQWSRNI